MKLQLSKNVKVSFNKYLFLILLSFISTSLEIFGVGIFIPIFEFMKMNGDISALTSQSSYWENFVNYFERFNYEKYGGTPILGLNKTVIIGHGISNEIAIKNMILLTKDVINANLAQKIKTNLT